MFQPSIRVRKKGDLTGFKYGMVFDAIRLGLNISESADLKGFSDKSISWVYRELFVKSAKIH